MNTPAKLKKSAKKMCNVCEKKIAGNAPEFDPVDPIFLKFMSYKEATKIDEIFIVDLTLCRKCQIESEDFVNFCGLLRKQEL